LVQLVRGASAPDDTVLLLPEDPNVVAWFERPRPLVSSAILFVDQYPVDRVAGDVDPLVAHPPKVVVIGPQTERQSIEGWNTSIVDLVGLAPARLLDGRYRLLKYQPITYHGHPDAMEVWVRVGPAPPAAAAGS